MSKLIRSYGVPGNRLLMIGSVAIWMKNTSRHHLYFSERNGYGPRSVTLFGWRFSISWL